MKRYRILTAIFAASLVIASAVFTCAHAAPEKRQISSSFIGSADMTTLMVLHPLMVYYSFENELFIKPFEKGYRPADLAGIAAARRQASASAREFGLAEIASIKKEIEAINEEHRTLMTGVNREQDSLTKAYSEEFKKLRTDDERRARTNRHLQDFSKIDLRYYAEKKAIDEKVRRAHEKLSAASEKISGADFAVAGAGRELLDRIVSEINAAIAETASEHGVSVVLNSSFSNDLVTVEKPAGEAPAAGTEQPVVSATAEVSAAKPFTYEDPAGMYAARLAASRIFGKTGALSSTIVSGGPDLTAPALEKLLKKYSMPKENTAMLIEALGAIRKTDGRQAAAEK